MSAFTGYWLTRGRLHRHAYPGSPSAVADPLLASHGVGGLGPRIGTVTDDRIGRADG